MFDLDKAIAAWRQSLRYNRAFTADDLDELEQHVRDQVEALRRRGVSEKEAFQQAVREMGEYSAAEREYRKVYWGKLKRQGVRRELQWRAAMGKNYLFIALRTLKRHKGHTAINITGLAVAWQRPSSSGCSSPTSVPSTIFMPRPTASSPLRSRQHGTAARC